MTKILLILSSPRGTASLSARFALELTERLRSCGIGTSLLVRDLADPPLPHVDVSYINGRTRNADERSRAETQAVELAKPLIGELQLADIVIIASSMVNFSVSSVLKTCAAISKTNRKRTNSRKDTLIIVVLWFPRDC